VSGVKLFCCSYITFTLSTLQARLILAHLQRGMDDRDFSYTDSVCVICQIGFDVANEKGKRVKATHRGIASLQRYSVLHADERLEQFLASNPAAVYYHSECHKAYTSERLLEQQKRRSGGVLEAVVPPKSLRSSSAGFLWKEHCFLCSTPVTLDTRYHGAKDNKAVRTLELHDTVKEACRHRHDAWSLHVSGRLESCNDLVAEEAVYHKQCYSNFVTGRRNPNDLALMSNIPSMLTTEKWRPLRHSVHGWKTHPICIQSLNYMK
jgi:hypothetical protein